MLFMVLPVEVGILTPLLIHHRLGLAALVATLFFSAVCVPLFVGLRRKRRQQLLWGGRAFLIATGFVLSLNLLWFASVLMYNLFR
jgi:hypothetical protein